MTLDDRDRRSTGLSPLGSVSASEFIEVPPRDGDRVRYAFSFRRGPSGVLVVHGQAAFEVDPDPESPSQIRSRPPADVYKRARDEAFALLLKSPAKWGDLDPIPDAVMQVASSGEDVTKDIVGFAVKRQAPELDDAHYADCAIRYVTALRSGNMGEAAERAAMLGAKRSTAKRHVAEAQRRGFVRAAEELPVDALTTDAVVHARWLHAVRSGEFQLTDAARWMLHTVGSLDPAAIETVAMKREMTVTALREEASRAAKAGRVDDLPPLTDAETAAVAEHIVSTQQRTDTVLRAGRVLACMLHLAGSRDPEAILAAGRKRQPTKAASPIGALAAEAIRMVVDEQDRDVPTWTDEADRRDAESRLAAAEDLEDKRR